MAELSGTRAGLYTRISEARETREGLERHARLARQLAEGRGWQIVAEHEDNDLPAVGKVRPGYEALKRDVQAHRLDVIVTYEHSRLERDQIEWLRFLDFCADHGVSVIAAVRGGDQETPRGIGRAMAGFAGFVAEQERRRLIERTRDAARDRAEKGEYHGGPRPFGYMGAGAAEICEPEAALIRQAYQMLLLEDATLNAVTRTWEASGIRPPRKPDQGWRTQSIKAILTGPRIIGARTYRGEIMVSDAVPAIIERAQWERLKFVLSDPARRTGPRTRGYLLTGTLYCLDCDIGMVGSSWSGRQRYVCKREQGGCARSISAVPVEGWITRAVLHRLASQNFEAALDGQRHDDGYQAASKALLEAEQHLEELAAERGRREITQREWKVMRAAAQQEIDAARARLKRTQAGAALARLPRGEALRKAWKDEEVEGGLTFRRRVLSAVLRKVTVAATDRHGPRKFQPERLDPDWIA